MPKAQKYYFFPEDFLLLEKRIKEAQEAIRRLKEPLADRRGQGSLNPGESSTFMAVSQENSMKCHALERFMNIHRHAVMTKGANDRKKVGIGSTVIFQNLESRKKETYRIGSYMVFQKTDPPTISYDSPLAQLLMDAKPGEKREGQVGDRQRSLKILKIT